MLPNAADEICRGLSTRQTCGLPRPSLEFFYIADPLCVVPHGLGEPALNRVRRRWRRAVPIGGTHISIGHRAPQPPAERTGQDRVFRLKPVQGLGPCRVQLGFRATEKHCSHLHS